ncbi:MAG: hypothetical protein PHE78_01325 [Candidatus Gastranaerophilales bacterium]|nr:hypothetical protein [Candidatus Gastranaerophilales bacterium]
MKKCPLKHENCTEECSLYIAPDELSETMRNKLASIGILSREEGFCSFKVMAMSQARYIFERSSTLR